VQSYPFTFIIGKHSIMYVKQKKVFLISHLMKNLRARMEKQQIIS